MVPRKEKWKRDRHGAALRFVVRVAKYQHGVDEPGVAARLDNEKIKTWLKAR